MTTIDVVLKKADRSYRPGDIVAGIVVVSSKSAFTHGGITLTMEGVVTLQLSAKSTGMFEAFYNSLKPVLLVHVQAEVAPSGKLPDGVIEFPFEFKLEALAGQQLVETYHGVFVNVQYNLRCNCVRGMLAKNIEKIIEFIVEVKTESPLPQPTEIPFCITPAGLKNVKAQSNLQIPNFKLSGKLTTATCLLTKPFTGELNVEESEGTIQSIELQLVRVETCGCADGYAKEATEIQNIQIADGDVPHGLPIPLFMVFPRLFTCPTIAQRTFKVEFEVNLVVLLSDGHLIKENFPIRMYRS
eukprot:TRINITY_DN13172_c0_g1_i1.p1 TRINITY_DN13172_c0_g1~~TRINITY_DN13172_c0_g1_i1.p1  ORF type:complete len:299 (+),score=28.02 TRINITY_DN13172_c0_g1_i1:26-922(+)